MDKPLADLLQCPAGSECILEGTRQAGWGPNVVQGAGPGHPAGGVGQGVALETCNLQQPSNSPPKNTNNHDLTPCKGGRRKELAGYSWQGSRQSIHTASCWWCSHPVQEQNLYGNQSWFPLRPLSLRMAVFSSLKFYMVSPLRCLCLIPSCYRNTSQTGLQPTHEDLTAT